MERFTAAMAAELSAQYEPAMEEIMTMVYGMIRGYAEKGEIRFGLAIFQYAMDKQNIPHNKIKNIYEKINAELVADGYIRLGNPDEYSYTWPVKQKP